MTSLPPKYRTVLYKSITTGTTVTQDPINYVPANLKLILYTINVIDNFNICEIQQLKKIHLIYNFQNFNINVKDLNWPSYIEEYIKGTKMYVLKEDFGKLKKNRAAIFK